MNQRTIVGIAAVLALIAGLYMAVNVAPPSTAQPQYLQTYPQPRQLPDFTLYDQHGEDFKQGDLQDHWTLAFVGYTFCPDICPTTLAELSKVYPQLSALDSEYPLQIWFISVDPERDTSARLKEYIDFFNADFVASSAEHAELFPLVRAMGLMYSMSDDMTKPNYLVDHSASVSVLNPDGLVIGRFKPQHEPGKMAISDSQQIIADLPIIMNAYAK